MIVVTSGAKYIDIDAYAGCVAYAELMNLLGRPAIAVSTAVWNESITASLRALPAPFSADYVPRSNDSFVMTDLSDPARFDGIVDEARVIEVLDHHPGFERYWADKLSDNSRIEFIGAAATLVYERWAQAGRAGQMSRQSATLLAAAILDNTLNFGAAVTTDRDRAAYRFLSGRAGLDGAWAARYFRECQEAITSDVAEALRNDTKLLKFRKLDDELCFGQLVVWDASSVLAGELDTVAAVLGGMRRTWMANVISIADSKSYFVARDPAVKAWAKQLMGVTFDGLVAPAGRLWLRKEIMKSDQAAP